MAERQHLIGRTDRWEPTAAPGFICTVTKTGRRRVAGGGSASTTDDRRIVDELDVLPSVMYVDSFTVAFVSSFAVKLHSFPPVNDVHRTYSNTLRPETADSR